MKTKTQFSTLVWSSLLLLNGACAVTPNEADLIADAQNCMDKATSENVHVCVAKVEGLESEGAYRIRCAGKFVKEGFSSPDRLAATMSSLNGKDTDASGSTSMMAALAFTTENSTALNSASANEAFEFCTKSKSKGMVLLSGLTKTSTSIAKFAGLANTNMTGDDLKNLMGTLKDDPEAQAAVGSAIATIYTMNCSGESTTAGNYCAQFEAAATQAGGVTNTTALGQTVMKCYNDPELAECKAFQ